MADNVEVLPVPDRVRELPNWIDGFMEYTDRIRSPARFRRWAAYSTISGVMERKLWSWVSGFQCYPNVFVLLVAGPGIGKTVAVREVTEMWKACRGVRIGPNGMTKAALIDHISESYHEFMYQGKTQKYYPLCLSSNEFGVLMPDYNLELLNFFNELYDCNIGIDDRTRKDGLKNIEKPFLTLIAGTQPMYLGHILPPTAFGMGFTSRIIMVHASERKDGKMFERNVKPVELQQKLVHDLKIIQKIVGEMEPSEEAEEWMEEWYQVRDYDGPRHPLLQNYNERRPASVQKLAMINSLARSNDLIIEKEDYEVAIRMLLEAEQSMPHVFKEMTQSEDKKILDEIQLWCLEYCAKQDANAVPESDLTDHIARKTSILKVMHFLNVMIDTGRLKIQGPNNKGYRKFIARNLDI